MKRCIVFLVLAVCLFPAAVFAQHPGGASDSSATGIEIDKVELGWSQSRADRYLGDDNLGSYWLRKFEARILSGRDALVSYSTTSNDWSRVDVSLVDANNRVGSFGLNVPVSRLLGFEQRISIRYLESRWVDIKDSSVEASGIYTDYRPTKNWRFESGMEMFRNEPPELYYAIGETKLPERWPLISYFAAGVARQYNQKADDHHFEERGLLGGVIPLDSSMFIGVATSFTFDLFKQVSWNRETRAWAVTFTKQAMENDRTWEPTWILTYRSKSKSRYFLGMAALGGGINRHMARGMTFAAYPTMLRPTRIVSNQEFHLKELNDPAQSWGRITWNAGWFEFDLSDELSVQSFQTEVYHTLEGWQAWKFFDPFWGAIYSSEDDVTFNPRAREMQAPNHQQWGVSLGTYAYYYGDSESRLELTVLFGDGFQPEYVLLNIMVWL